MGKTIIQQARGRGSLTYRVRRKAFIYRLQYPRDLSGAGIVIKLIKSGGHSAPVAKVQYGNGIFFIRAEKGVNERIKKNLGKKAEEKPSNILKLKDVPLR